MVFIVWGTPGKAMRDTNQISTNLVLLSYLDCDCLGWIHICNHLSVFTIWNLMGCRVDKWGHFLIWSRGWVIYGRLTHNLIKLMLVMIGWVYYKSILSIGAKFVLNIVFGRDFNIFSKVNHIVEKMLCVLAIPLIFNTCPAAKGIASKSACILVQVGYNTLNKLRYNNTFSCQVLICLYTWE